MSLTGDLTHLGRIGSDVASLSDVPRLARALASERIEALIQLEFDAGVDPYGVAWTPLAKATTDRGRFSPPLTDTRELRESTLVYPVTAGGIRATVGTGSHPAGPHQDGWSGRQGNGPARPILPTTSLPLAWEMAIDDSVIDAVTAKLRDR